MAKCFWFSLRVNYKPKFLVPKEIWTLTSHAFNQGLSSSISTSLYSWQYGSQLHFMLPCVAFFLRLHRLTWLADLWDPLNPYYRWRKLRPDLLKWSLSEQLLSSRIRNNHSNAFIFYCFTFLISTATEKAEPFWKP